MTHRLLARRAAALLLLLAAACRSSDQPAPEVHAAHKPLPAPSPAITIDGTAYETAMRVTLPPESPEEYEGLHNVFRLSENVISGSEPHGAEALEEIRAMGVKTILSVDGKIPEGTAAQELGLRYVHIPIEYKGMTDDELAEIAKTFRELEGPFYVHCFHGKHRGPAAAAVGRIVLDGVDRQVAIAEMRQYCGTSSKYEGLYRDIATAYIPAESETEALRFDFPAAKAPVGVAGFMVDISRANDNVDLLAKRAFAVDPAHPDVDALNEARILQQSFEGALELDEVKSGPEDYRGWFEASLADTRALIGALERGEVEQADASWNKVKASCSACHKVYRD